MERGGRASSLALYRKYRSKSLDEIVGQTHITDTLKAAIKAKKFAHAYLLTGPRGTGKTSIARILAHEINQISYQDDAANLDIIEIDAASNRRIDDIRELREKVHIAPVNSTYKIYIIDEVHMLTSESFNALLKTLEEPPRHVIFILATTELHKLPATIISRTQRYTFRLIEPADMIAHLRHIADSESIPIEDDALALIAEHGEGAFRDSINLLDQLASSTDKQLTAEMVEAALGLAPHELIKALAEACIAHHADAALVQLSTFERQGVATSSIVRQLIKQLQVAAPHIPSLYQLIDALIEVPRSSNARLKLLTTILLYINQEPKHPAPPPSHKAVAMSPKKPALTVSAPMPATKKTTDPPKAAKKEVTITKDQWPHILHHLKTTNPPLYTIAKRATATVEQDGKLLILTFGYKLHAKKIDSPKYRAQLAQTIASVCDACPDISVRVVAITKPTNSTPDPANRSQTNSVIAMMGGGDVIQSAEIPTNL